MTIEEISINEYKVTKCSITNEECQIISCISCDTAKDEEHIRKCESDREYLFIDKTTKINGIHYPVNSRFTVVKVPIHNLDMLLEHLSLIPNMSIPSLDPEFINDRYPEWEKTRKLNNINEKIEKYFYSEGKPLIIIYEKEVYAVMPILR